MDMEVPGTHRRRGHLRIGDTWSHKSKCEGTPYSIQLHGVVTLRKSFFLDGCNLFFLDVLGMFGPLFWISTVSRLRRQFHPERHGGELHPSVLSLRECVQGRWTLQCSAYKLYSGSYAMHMLRTQHQSRQAVTTK